MIEANACADTQVSEMEIVLHESGVFTIMARIVERKIQRSGGIEDRLAIDFSLRDVVRERLANSRIDRIHTRFKFVVFQRRGQSSGEISFAKTTVLKYFNRC